jgi:hypothetical protein
MTRCARWAPFFAGGRKAVLLLLCFFCGARVTFQLQFVVDVELVWSNALLYNKDPSHLVYVDTHFLFLPQSCDVFDSPFIRHQAALRGRDELWRASQYPFILGTLHKMV